MVLLIIHPIKTALKANKDNVEIFFPFPTVSSNLP